MTQKGLPSSLDLAYEEAEGASFGLPANVDEQIKQQRERAAQRRQEASQPLEMPSIPQGVGGNSRAGTGKVPYMEHFAAAAQRYGVPINVLIGLAEQESRFNPTALGTQTKWGRAKGLMQYLDSTAAGMGINPYDPAQSIDAAARQLKQRLDKGYSMIDAVREHFAGPDRKLWGPKTHTYGVEVMQRASRYGNVAPISGGEAPSPTATRQTRPTAQSNNPDPNRFRPLSESELKKIQDAQMNGDDEVVLQIGMKPVKIMGGDPVIQKQRQQKIDDAGILSQFGNALSSGYDNTKRHVSNAVWMMTGDSTGAVADSIYEGYRQQQQAQKNRTSGQKRLDAAIDAVGDGEGFLDTISRGLSAVKVAIQEPRATFLGSAESAASMLPTIAGGLAGAGAGGAVGAAGGAASGAVAGGVGAIPGAAAGGIGGAIWGGRIGMVAGTTASEAGAELEHMVFERLKDQKKSVTKENIRALLNDPKFRAEAQKQGTTKGLTLAMVDQLTMGAAGRVLSAPAKQAEKKAVKEIVKDTGVDEKAARSLLASPAGRAALAKNNPDTLKKAVAATGAFSIELLGEPAGEAISQAVARGEVDWSDVTGEFIYGAGTAVAGTAAAGAINAGQATADRIRSGGANAQNETQVEPAAAAPAAPERKIGAIERAVGGEQSLDAAIDAEIAAVTGQPQPDSIEQLINQQTATDANEGITAEQWLGQPGQTVQVSPKEDPDATYTVTIEGYENGEVFARDQDGTPVQFGQNDIVSATPVQQTAPITENVQLEESPAPELTDFGVTASEAPAAAQPDANLSDFDTAAPQAAPDQPRAQPVEVDSPEKTLAKMDEAELRARIKYLAGQAKATGGWNKRLMEERRKVEAEINRRNKPEIDDKPYHKWEGMSPEQRQAMATKAGFSEEIAKDLSGRSWGSLDKSITDKLTAKPAPKAKAAKAPEVKQPEAKKPDVDYSDAVPEQKQAATQEVAPFRQLIIDAHFNNPPMKAQLIQAEVKAGRPRHEVMKDVQDIVADIKAGKITAPAAQAPAQETNTLTDKGTTQADKVTPSDRTPNPYNENELRAQVRDLNKRERNIPEFNKKVEQEFPNLFSRAQELAKTAKLTAAGRRGNTNFKSLEFKGDDTYVSGDPWPNRPTEDEILQQAIWHLSQKDESNSPDPTVAKTTSQAKTQTDESGPLLGADGKPKWFMSQEKAQAFIEKKKLTDQYQVKKVDNRRFEIHPVVADAKQPTASDMQSLRAAFKRLHGDEASANNAMVPARVDINASQIMINTDAQGNPVLQFNTYAHRRDGQDYWRTNTRLDDKSLSIPIDTSKAPDDAINEALDKLAASNELGDGALKPYVDAFRRGVNLNDKWLPSRDLQSKRTAQADDVASAVGSEEEFNRRLAESEQATRDQESQPEAFSPQARTPSPVVEEQKVKGFNDLTPSQKRAKIVSAVKASLKTISSLKSSSVSKDGAIIMSQDGHTIGFNVILDENGNIAFNGRNARTSYITPDEIDTKGLDTAIQQRIEYIHETNFKTPAPTVAEPKTEQPKKETSAVKATGSTVKAGDLIRGVNKHVYELVDIQYNDAGGVDNVTVRLVERRDGQKIEGSPNSKRSLAEFSRTFGNYDLTRPAQQPTPKSKPSDFIQVVSIGDKKAPTAEQVVEKLAPQQPSEIEQGVTLKSKTTKFGTLNSMSRPVEINFSLQNAESSVFLARIVAQPTISDAVKLIRDYERSNILKQIGTTQFNVRVDINTTENKGGHWGYLEISPRKGYTLIKAAIDVGKVNQAPVALGEISTPNQKPTDQQSVYSAEPATVEKKTDQNAGQFADNKLFTADKVAAARARLKSKLGQLNSGIDPEVLVDGMTIAGAYIESGVRKFSDYAKAMVEDLGDGVKPYLLSFWEGARNYPGLDNTGMTSVEDSAKEHAALLKPEDTQTEAVGQIAEKPKARTKKTGAKGDMVITQDWGVTQIDGYGDGTRETGNDTKDAFLKETRNYLNAVADALRAFGFEPHQDRKGKPEKPVSVNESGMAGSGDVSLTMTNPDNGNNVYITIGDSALRGVVPMTASGIAIMYRVGQNGDRYATRATNTWAPVDLSANDLAALVNSRVRPVANTEENQNARTVQSENVPAGDQGGNQSDVTTGNRDSEPVAAGVAETSESTDRSEPVSASTQGTGRGGTRGVQPGQSASGASRDSGTVRPGLSTADAVSGDTLNIIAADKAFKRIGFKAISDGLWHKREGKELAWKVEPTFDNKGLMLQAVEDGQAFDELRLDFNGTPKSDVAIYSDFAKQISNYIKSNENPVTGADVGTKQADPATAETSPKPELDQDFDLANEEIGKGGLTKKYKDNIAAIRILKAMEAESRVATPEERKQIARYVGWGALKGVFDKDNKQWSKEYAELKGLLTDAEYKAARASTLNAHYTSPTVVGGIFKALEQVGFTSGRVLEPSVGTGNFFGLMPASMRKKSQLHGVELDPLTSQIAAALYPSAKIAKATGFQDFQVPSEYFDLAIGNPPFGSEPIVDSDRSPYSGSSIHNYFFAKSIDKLRPGGLLTMVVSHNFMDANNETTRKWISERADLVSAVRLPRTAFKENAGTDVVTDILVFRKRAAADGAGDASWVKTGTQKLTDPKTGNEVEHRVSSYFLANPNNVLGTPSAAGSMYRAAEYTVEPSGDLSKQLSDWAGTLPANMYQPIERTHEPEAADVSVPDGVKVGSFFVGENGAISVRGPDAMGNRTATEWTPPNAKAAERMKGMIGLRDALREQMRLEKSPDTTTEQIEANRAELNRLYDEFNKKYGFLNDQTNRRLFLDDTESALLLALEFDYDKGVSKAVAAREEIDPRDPSAVKADIFNRRVMFPPADNIKVSNANDALLASLNYKARLDLPYMASLYDKTEAEIIQELGDVVYNDPINGYVMADEYLSGDVKTKLAEAQEAAKDNPDFKRNVEALKKIIPADKLPSEIHAALGASFIPTELFEQFAKEVTGADHRVAYVKATGQWVIDPRGQTNDSLNVGKWGIAKMPATAIFARTMAGQGVVVTETVRLGGGKTETRVLEKETEAAREKQAAMKAEWQRWLWADPDRADRVASIYNEKMNRIVVRKYDGSHMTFPGMSPAINLLEHQKNAVWRALQSRQVLLDHTVGAGKTFEIVALFMEMRRLGISRKPFIAVPNHLTLQWRSEFSRLYPAANVLAATPEDFSKGNREKFFSKIVTGDWDAVIVGHSSLKKIALPPETEKAVLEEQINEIADAIDQMKRERGDRNIIRDMEGIRARLAARMTQRIQALGERDKVVTFDELGVDAFAIDELHEFKNLFYNSTMERVPGMGNPAGSDKAFDLFVKLQWMFNTYGDKAPIAGATGTPVSNSLVEMFNMQRLLQYPTLKKDGLHVFDAWAKQFGSVESLYEVAPSGTGYRQSSRFAKFKNLPALMSHYQTFADTVTLDDLKAQEEAQGKAFPVPKVFGGRPQNIVAKRSPNVASFMGTPELDIQDGQVQFGFNVAAGDRFEITKSKEGEHFNVVIVQNIDGAEVMQHLGTAKTEEDARLMLVEQALSPKIHVDPKSILGQFSNLKELNKKTKGKVNALSLTGQANKAGLDYRLVDPTAPDFAGSKINMAIDRMMDTYHKWDADKGTQLIFCDLSVPKSARSGFGSKERRVYVRDEKGAIVHKKGTLHTAEGFEDLPHLVIKEGKEFAIYDAATGLRIRGQLPSKAVALEWTKQTLGDEAKRQRWIDARDAAGDLDQDAIDDYNNANEINTEETEAISLSDIAGASGAAGFSVYDDIKAKLIAKGVPEREIAFIHDYSTPVAKDKLFKAVNSGAIRFLLGSTPKMGAGTNVQKRLVGLHHIDAPWRPSDLEQREGRIIRRGNILYERDPSGFEVEIYRYATEQTYDTRRWQILEHKSRGIEQLRNYDGTVNEIDDIEGEAANAADMKAAASGDPLILEETQLRNDVRRLESLQAAHADSTQMLFRRARDNQRFADEVGPRALQEFQDLQATAEKNPVKKDQFAGLTMNGRKIADREEAVKAIQKEMVRVFAGGSDASFTYRGIEFTLDNTMGYVELNSPTGRLDSFDPSKDTLPSAAGFLTRFANYISRIPAHIEDLNAKIAEAQRDAVELREQANNPFAQAEELNAAREAHKRVQRRLIAKGPDIPAKQKPVLDQAMEAQKAALRDQGLGDAMDEFIGSRQNSRGQVTSTGTTVAEVREALVNRFGEKTIAKLEKDGTLNIIDVLNEPGVEGFTTGGKVTLVADALTAESIVPVFLHELGGHVGFQGTMSPEAHANLVDQFNKLVRAGDPIALEAKRLAEREADAAAQQAEYLPYLVTVAAQTQNKRPGIRNLIARIVSAVKAWAVDRLGINISLNANDVLALAERMVNTVAENSTQVANDTVSFSRADNDLAPVGQEEYRSKLGQWWSEAKQLPSDLLTNSMRGWGLNIIPLRPMLTEMAKDIPAAKTYLRIKDQMDAMRNEWHAKTDAVAQNWLKYRIKNREENRDLMDLMHEATLMQVDPSKPFESILTPRERMALESLSPGSPNRKTLEDKAEKDAQRQEAHKRLTDRYNALSPEGQSIFGQVRDAYSDMADAFDQTLLNNMEKAINVRIKKAEREYKREMERIQDEGLQGDERDNAVADADRRLKNAKTKIAWNRKARMTQLRQQFETQRLAGPYFPLARFGEFFVTVRDAETGEVVSFSRFESAREQRRFAEDMRKDKDYKVEVGALTDATATRKAVDPNFVADVEDILADLPNAEQVKDEVWQRYLESLPDMSIRKARIHRKGRAGYAADAVRAFGHHLFHGSHQLARMAHSMDLEDALDQARDEARETKDPTRSSLIVNEMEKRHQFVMNPTGGQLATWASSFAFVWYLAGSPKAALMNLFQTPIMGVPILGAYAGGLNGIARAGNQLTKALVDFTSGRGHAERSARLNDEERDAMRKGYETGIIEKTQGHELAGVAESGVEYNAIRERVMKVIAWGFHHTERLNREVTFLAGYRLARAKGESHDQAITTAADLTWKTHFDYSNTSRPRLMHNDWGKVLLVFRNFQVNMLFRLFRDIHQVMHADSKEARREALTQLSGITGMMMLNAGITGTWGFGIAMLMAGLFMGEGEDPEEELKKGMVNMLGPNLAGLALYGAPGHITGIALSESVGMPDLWFRSPDSQMESEEALQYWQSQLLGAVPSIGAQIARGVKYIGQGEEYRGIETMMPKMLKDPMKSYRYATEGAKNMKGDTVADVTWADVVKQATGFTPARISEQYKINNLNYNKQQQVLKARKELMDGYYKAVKADDSAAVDEVLSRIEKHNEKNPDQPITPKGLIQSIKTRERGADSAVGGMRYNNKLRERILEEQAPSIYK